MRFLSAVRFVLVLFVLTSCSQDKSTGAARRQSDPDKNGKGATRARARIRIGERYGDIA